MQASGPLYKTYAEALALVGRPSVTGISIVVDSGWAFADTEQTVRVRNVKINGSTFFAPETLPTPPTGMNAAQACKKLRADMGLAAFRTAYGTNANGANAFGKCVSKLARMKNDAARAAAVGRIDRDAERCAAVNAEDQGQGQGEGPREAAGRVPQGCRLAARSVGGTAKGSTGPFAVRLCDHRGGRRPALPAGRPRAAGR